MINEEMLMMTVMTPMTVMIDQYSLELETLVKGRFAKILELRPSGIVSQSCQISCLLTMGSTSVKHSVLNVKALVGAFNQEKALVGAFSVITNLRMDLRFKL